MYGAFGYIFRTVTVWFVSCLVGDGVIYYVMRERYLCEAVCFPLAGVMEAGDLNVVVFSAP